MALASSSSNAGLRPGCLGGLRRIWAARVQGDFEKCKYFEEKRSYEDNVYCGYFASYVLLLPTD